jgi:PST family polysaccharide transporter
LVVLARYLDKAEFGLAGMAGVFIVLLSSMSDLGMGVLGVQREHPDERRIAVLGLGGGAGATLLLWLAAPYAAGIFGESDELAGLIRTGAALPLCAGLLATARARLARRLAYERVAGLDMELAIISAAGRIGFAMQGYGAWSIVYGDLLGAAFGTVSYWMVAPRPEAGRPGPLLRDGLHVVGTRVADTVFGQLDRFFVGVGFGTSALGLYAFAYPHAMAVVRHGSPVAEQTAFPWFSRLRGAELAGAYAKLTRLFALIALPFATAVWVAAPTLIDWIYPDRWQEAVPILRGLCIAAFCAGLNSFPGLVWLALGRMRLRMVVSIVNVVVLAAVLPWVAFESIPYVLAARSLVATIVGQIITKRLVGISHARYAFELAPGFVASIGIATLALLAGVRY